MHQVPIIDGRREVGARVLDDGVTDSPDDGEGAPPAATRVVSGPDGPVRVRVLPGVRAPRGARRPVLVAFHGWTDSGECFAPLAEALGRRWTVVAPDAPGHGGTPWPAAAEYVVADHLAGAVAVLDALPRLTGRRAPVVVLGHSMGALTAARVAAARRGVVRHLVLEDPARTTLRAARSAAAWHSWLSALQEEDDAARADSSRRTDPTWPEDERGPWARSKAEADLRHLEVPVDWGEPLMALLAEVACPVTLVRGRPDRGGIVSMTGARRCASVCAAGCDVVALDAGHNPRREARAPFVAVLGAVLGRYER